MTRDHDAIVIGGGVGGATAAILLARAGWSIALVEKHAFPRRKVCGEALSAGNLGLLESLGVGAEFGELAGPALRRVALFARETTLTAALPRFDDPRHPWGRALGREHLDTLLVRRAAASGAEVWQPWTVTNVASRPDGDSEVVVEAGAESRRLCAPVVIFANGAWTQGPGERRVRTSARRSDLFAFKANFAGAELDSDLLPLLAFPGGYGGMVIADRSRLTLSCCIRRDALTRCRALVPGVSAGRAVQAHVEASCLGVHRALRNAERVGRWIAAGPIPPGIRSGWRGSGCFAVGNAAGEAHPIVAEGISMAIQSAWLLCERLLAEPGPPRTEHARARVGRDYESAWRKSFATRIHAAAVFAHLAMRPNAARVLLPLIRRYPFVLTVGARLAGKARRKIDPHSAAMQLSGDTP